jgi:tetratricopeptide (TPR) repeat protein
VIPFLFGHSLWVAWSAEARLLTGRADDARRAAAQALDLARKRGERGYEAWALRTLGRVAVEIPDYAVEIPDYAVEIPDYAEDAGPAREALALATALGMRPLEAHCHLDLARALGRSGHRAESAEHLERAAALYRELSMPFWLGRAEAAARDVA